jgi:glycosyltransferase involved in cell wall biosynthesis
LSWKKGIDILLEAFAATNSGQLVIAGTDDEGLSHTLRRAVEALGLRDRVHILARTIEGRDKYELFQQARLFILPSLSENFGNSVLEALAASLPVIVSPEVGAAEIVLRAGAGLVVAREVGALANALNAFLINEERAREFGRRGREYVLENCTWDAVAGEVEDLYLRCLSLQRMASRQAI